MVPADEAGRNLVRALRMKRTLILGANSAIAQEIAQTCAERGDRLFLVGRDETKLLGLLGRLPEDRIAGSSFADFTRTADNDGLLAMAVATLGGVDEVYIAHGWLGDQLESERSFAHADAVIAANFTSVVSLLVPLVNQLEEQGHGALVVLGSVAGDRGRPRNYTYGAAKGALHLYLQGVRSRLFASTGAEGARVVTIRLGPVDTPMTVDHKKTRLFARPADVAREIVALAASGPTDAYVPWFWRPIMGTVRNLPERVFQRFGFLAGR